MKKILSLFFILTLSLVSLLTLTACDKTNAEDLLKTFLIEQDGKNVKEDFSVPSSLTIGEETYDLTWSSNSKNLIIGDLVDTSYEVKVLRPEKEEEAKLTVSLSVSKKNTATKDFKVLLTPINVYDFVDEFSAPGVFKENGTNVTKDFALATEYALAKHPNEKATIVWESNTPTSLAISEDGKTAIVTPTSEEVSVILTAKFTYKGETSQARFKVKVSSPKSPYENLMYWYNNTGITQEISGYVVCVAAEYSESYGNISLYILDDTRQGGYYLYRTKADSTEAAKLLDANGNFKLGTHVTVTGASNTSYNGLLETNAGGNLVVDTDVEPINVEETYYAIDNDFVANAQSLYYRTSTLITLTNWKVVKVGDPIVAGSTSEVLTLEKNGCQIKIMFSKYIQNALGEANAAAFQAGLKDIKVGEYVNVKGLLSYYNTSKEGYNRDSYQILMTAPNSVTKGTADDAELPGVKVGAALEAFDAFQDLYVAPTNVTLPTELEGATIAWSIPETSVAKSVALEGNTLKVTPQASVETVNVVGTYTNGGYSTVVYYTFKTQSLDDAQMAEKALNDVKVDDQYVSGTVELPTEHAVLSGVTYTYALKETYKSATIAGNVLTIDNNGLTADEEITLVVTATKGKESKKIEITFAVKPLAPSTIAEFIKKADKTNPTLLQGIVTAVAGIGEPNSFILTDAEGTSIFCYDKLLNVALGDEIQVLAVYSVYNDFHQMAKPELVKTISTGNDVATKSGNVVEVTAAQVKENLSKTNGELVSAYAGKYLKVTGVVQESGGYYGLAAAATDESYVVNLYANKGIDLKSLVGVEITLYGFTRGVSTGKNITVQIQRLEEKELSPEEKVTAELGKVSLKESYNSGEVELPTSTNSEVTLTYTVKSGAENATIANGKLNLTAGSEAVEVVITVTAKCGDASKSKDLTLTVSDAEKQPITIAKFIEVADTKNKALLQGVVTAVNNLEKEDSFILTDAEGTSIFCYDKTLNVKLGDEIQVLAVYSVYNEFHQMAKPELVKTVSTGNDVTKKSGTAVAVTATQVKENLSKTNGELVSAYAGKYLKITGVVLQNGSYYGLASAATDEGYVVNLYANKGIDFSAHVKKEVVLYGFVRGVSSGKNITIQVQRVVAEPAPIETTIAELATNKPTTNQDVIYIVTGTWTTKEGTDPKQNTYGNGTLSDENGNSIVVYGLSSSKSVLTYADGVYTYKNAKDFLTLNVVDGSVIKVGMVYTSKFDNYSAYLIEIVNGEEGGGDTPVDPEEKPSLETEFTTTSFADIAAAVPGENEKGTEKVYAIGYVKEVVAWSNSLTIVDENETLLTVFGAKSFDGLLSLTQIPYELAAGTVVVVYGTPYNYKGTTLQLDGGVVVQIGTTVCTATDLHKVAVAANATKVATTATESFALPVTHAETSVAISWVSDNTDVISVDATGAAKVVVPTTDTLVTLTATFTLGTETKTVTYSVKVAAPITDATILAVFDFGVDGEAKHTDGSAIAEGKEYTVGEHTIVLTGVSKVYDGGKDATGVGAMKLGTGSAAATFTFTVGEDVNKVVIYVAGYKAATGQLSINGTVTEVPATSDSGEYTEIVIDTTTTKTIAIETTSSQKRAMIDKIVLKSE